jgi:hypothetical protein
MLAKLVDSTEGGRKGSWVTLESHSFCWFEGPFFSLWFFADEDEISGKGCACVFACVSVETDFLKGD